MPARRQLVRQEGAVERRVVRRGMQPSSVAATSAATAANARRVLHVVVGDLVHVAGLLGMGRPGFTSQFLRSTISPPRPTGDADLDDPVDRRVAPGRLDVDERDGQASPTARRPPAPPRARA
jgi:hypothetical protein